MWINKDRKLSKTLTSLNSSLTETKQTIEEQIKQAKQDMLQKMYPLNKIIISIAIPEIVTLFPTCFEQLDTSNQFIFTVNKGESEEYGNMYGENSQNINIEMNNLPFKEWIQKIGLDESINGAYDIGKLYNGTNITTHHSHERRTPTQRKRLKRVDSGNDQNTDNMYQLKSTWNYGTQSKQAITINKLPKHMPVYAYKVIKLITLV